MALKLRPLRRPDFPVHLGGVVAGTIGPHGPVLLTATACSLVGVDEAFLTRKRTLVTCSRCRRLLDAS